MNAQKATRRKHYASHQCLRYDKSSRSPRSELMSSAHRDQDRPHDFVEYSMARRRGHTEQVGVVEVSPLGPSVLLFSTGLIKREPVWQEGEGWNRQTDTTKNSEGTAKGIHGDMVSDESMVFSRLPVISQNSCCTSSGFVRDLPVIMNALARETPSPIHAVFHSHNLRRKMRDRGVDGLEGKGMSSESKAVIPAGPRTTTAMRTGTLTVSAL